MAIHPSLPVLTMAQTIGLMLNLYAAALQDDSNHLQEELGPSLRRCALLVFCIDAKSGGDVRQSSCGSLPALEKRVA